jgi:hypothetical protein
MGTERPRLRDILAGDDWMKIGADAGMSVTEIAKALAPLSGLSAGMYAAVLTAGDSLAHKLGVKNSKRVEQRFAVPYPILVRALVLALHSQRYAIMALFDTPNGAFIEAQLPNDFRSLGGVLRFDVVEERANAMHVVAASEIRQMFDWGKGKQALNAVLDKTELFASRLLF